MPSPQLFVNGDQYQITPMGNVVKKDDEQEKIPEIQISDLDNIKRSRDFKNLRALLGKSFIRHKDKHIDFFWPDQLLGKIMTKERVIEELQSMKRGRYSDIFAERTIDEYADLLTPSRALRAKQMKPKQYFKIFVILLRCQRKGDIIHFIDAGTCDADLPLTSKEIDGKTRLMRGSHRLESAVNFRKCKWRSVEIEAFCSTQWKVLVPSLRPPFNPLDKSEHVLFDSRAILPFTKEDISKQGEGGYGSVSCMQIHPSCHEFHHLPQVKVCKGLFAVKTMIHNEHENFLKEQKMSKLFGGNHKHIITLLMSYEHEKRHFLLYPWADGDLIWFWKTHSAPYNSTTNYMSQTDIKWVSEQIVGLVSGLDAIHNPKNLSPEEQKRWGRHGDLKADNILVFHASQLSDSVLVINDLGLTAIHGIKSRSNVPHENVPLCPNYRPPECDQEGGKISRSFDIWTLGCLLLDMACWTLGGFAMVERFNKDREEVVYLGNRENIFFDVKKTVGGKSVILIKETVAKCIHSLHGHPGCTNYLHELLDIISQEMLVVLSKRCERIRSEKLLERVQGMHAKIGNFDYGQRPNPQAREYQAPVAVEAVLDHKARKNFNRFRDMLTVHNGELLPPKTVREMGNVR